MNTKQELIFKNSVRTLTLGCKTMNKQNWFNTLNESLASEGLTSLWPLGLNIGYCQHGRVVRNGMFLTVYRDETGRYERPIYYSSAMDNQHHIIQDSY